MLELLNTDQRIIRSIYLNVRKHIIEHGYYPDTSVYTDLKDPLQVADFNNKIKGIISTKGFYIDVYSESSARNKGKKEAPRIVMFLSRVYEGEIGAPPNMIMADPINLGNYRSGALPGRASNIVLAVHLISSNSEQHFKLNSIISNVLGQRAYIELYDAAADELPFYVYQTSFADLDDPTENITEKVYFYTVPDVYLGDITVHRDNIKPIKEIRVDIEPTKDVLEVKSDGTKGGFIYNFDVKLEK